MDTSNVRPNQGANGDFVDWRDQLSADSRHRIVGKIMDTLRRHLPALENEEIQDRAVRCEEKIHTVATCQSDYLRKISIKMLSMATRALNPMPYARPLDPGADPKDGVVIDPPQDNDVGSSKNVHCVTCGNQAQ